MAGNCCSKRCRRRIFRRDKCSFRLSEQPEALSAAASEHDANRPARQGSLFPQSLTEVHQFLLDASVCLFNVRSPHQRAFPWKLQAVGPPALRRRSPRNPAESKTGDDITRESQSPHLHQILPVAIIVPLQLQRIEAWCRAKILGAPKWWNQ